MAESNEKDLLVGDPLSEVTRKQRRMLLVVSAVSIAVTKTGLIPTKISALGIDFKQTDQESLLLVFSMVVLYFGAAFLIYGMADLLAWRRSRLKYRINYRKEQALLQKEHGPEFVRASYLSPPWFSVPRRLVSSVREVFEFLLPIIIGIYSLILLYTYDVPAAAS
jgi:hypothetical protein